MRDRKSDTTHRKAAEAKIGRKLVPGEDVHHANDDKADNAPANLEVKPHAAHTSHSNRTRGLTKLRHALQAFRKGRKSY